MDQKLVLLFYRDPVSIKNCYFVKFLIIFKNMKLSQSQKNQLKKLAQKYHLKLILLFGSQVKGPVTPESDVDIAVLGDINFNFKKILFLSNDLEKILNKEIDLALLNTASPFLKFQVAKNSQLLYGKNRDYAKFKIHAFSEYADSQIFFELQDKLIKQQLK